MDALDALVTRASPLRLAPQEVEEVALARILDAGLRAADVMADALRRRNPVAEAASLEAERQKPLRAPLIVVVAAVVRAGTKIPPIEQIESAAAAAQNMLVAAHGLGLGGFWRTGAPAYDAYVKSALGLSPDDQIVALLYIGHIAAPGTRRAPDPAGVVEEWRGPTTEER